MTDSIKKIPIVDASTTFTNEQGESQEIEISKLQTTGYDLLKSEKKYYKNITRL